MLRSSNIFVIFREQANLDACTCCSLEHLKSTTYLDTLKLAMKVRMLDYEVISNLHMHASLIAEVDYRRKLLTGRRVGTDSKNMSSVSVPWVSSVYGHGRLVQVNQNSAQSVQLRS